MGNVDNTIETRREVAIRCLVVYPGEREEDLFKYLDAEGQIGDLESQVMKILVSQSSQCNYHD